MTPEHIKDTWITLAPDVLVFSIGRVEYDLKEARLVKNKKRFEFGKVIYADKYLIENKDSDIRKTERNDVLRLK